MWGQSFERSERVTIRDGKYTWTYEMNRMRNTYPLLGMMRISGWFGVAAFLAVWWLRGRNSGASMILPLVCGFAVTAIPAAVWFLKAALSKEPVVFRFEMDDGKISRFAGKQPEKSLEFGSVRSGKIWKRYDTIELRAGRNTLAVYAPSDMFDGLKDHILALIPEEADIRDME